MADVLRTGEVNVQVERSLVGCSKRDWFKVRCSSWAHCSLLTTRRRVGNVSDDGLWRLGLVGGVLGRRVGFMLFYFKAMREWKECEKRAGI